MPPRGEARAVHLLQRPTGSNWNRAKGPSPPAALTSTPTYGSRTGRSCSPTAGSSPIRPLRPMARPPPTAAPDRGGSTPRPTSTCTYGRPSAGSNCRSRAAWWRGGCLHRPAPRACTPWKMPSMRVCMDSPRSHARPRPPPRPRRSPSRPPLPAASRLPMMSPPRPEAWAPRGGRSSACWHSLVRMRGWRSSASS